jgi:hypothetical protein
MAKKKKPGIGPTRPYFVPAGIDFATLPEAVKLAFEVIVEPAYKEHVLGGATALERSAGVSLVFLLTAEILDQFGLGHRLNFTGAAVGKDSAERERLMARHLRLVNAKQQAAHFLLRIQELRKKNELAFDVVGPE